MPDLLSCFLLEKMPAVHLMGGWADGQRWENEEQEAPEPGASGCL